MDQMSNCCNRFLATSTSDVWGTEKVSVSSKVLPPIYQFQNLSYNIILITLDFSTNRNHTLIPLGELFSTGVPQEF